MTQRDSWKIKRRGLRRFSRIDHATSRSIRAWLRRPCPSICKPWMPQADQMLIKRSMNVKSTLCYHRTNSRFRTCLAAAQLNSRGTLSTLLSSRCSFLRWLKRAASTCRRSARGRALARPSKQALALVSLIIHSEANPSWRSLNINSKRTLSITWLWRAWLKRRSLRIGKCFQQRKETSKNETRNLWWLYLCKPCSLRTALSKSKLKLEIKSFSLRKTMLFRDTAREIQWDSSQNVKASTTKSDLSTSWTIKDSSARGKRHNLICKISKTKCSNKWNCSQRVKGQTIRECSWRHQIWPRCILSNNSHSQMRSTRGDHPRNHTAKSK